jgi:hypothetical protein
MKELDNIQREVSNKTKKVQKDIKELFSLYRSFQSEIESRFREEINEQGGRLEGLEDFYSFSLITKRNMQNIGNTLALISRVKDVSGYDITEETSTPVIKDKEKDKKVIKDKKKNEKTVENLIKDNDKENNEKIVEELIKEIV